MNSDPSKNLLVIRFSSLGDLGLLYPVLIAFLNQNKQHKITLVTKESFADLFKGIDRLEVLAVDLKEYQGIAGLISLAGIIRKSVSFTTVIDVHSVLRTRILGLLFKLKGKKVFRIDKMRKERNALARRKNKTFKQIPHITERYRKVFHDAGYFVEFETGPYLKETGKVELEQLFNAPPRRWIGIAPFAKWETKMLPIKKVEKLISMIDGSGNFNVLVFCSNTEKNQINHWPESYPSVYFNEKIGDLYDELQVISKLSLMVSMDSANMHLAAIAGTSVMTIWGSTHRFNGFASVNSDPENDVEIPASQLNCRPCTIFGNNHCWRGDHACMETIDIDKVFSKIVALVK